MKSNRRRVFPVAGGEFTGEKVTRDVRMLLKNDDGALILMTYRGVRHGSPEVNARIQRGEKVDGSEYYLRTAPFFETPSDIYSWINRIVAVGIGERRSLDAVKYEVFEIL